VVERDYPNLDKRFTSLAPLMSKLGNGGKGMAWGVEHEARRHPQFGDAHGAEADAHDRRLRQQSYGVNSYGTIGTNCDECVIVRKMAKLDSLDQPLAAAEAGGEHGYTGQRRCRSWFTLWCRTRTI
jgi:nitrate reductase alpha subunit